MKLKWFSVCAALCTFSSIATPWLDTQDNYLRQSLQSLAQAGLLTGPVNTYPIMWKNIAIDLNRIDSAALSPQLQFAVAHLRSALNANRGERQSGLKLKANSATANHQHFGESYFEDAALSLFQEVQSDSIAGRLQVNRRVLDDNITEQDNTLDGSYLALIRGNWVLQVDQAAVWWGPGQQSSLLLSNNARPLPSIRLTRHGWQPDERSWLRWLGPWSATTFLGYGQHNSAVPQTRYWGGRLTLRPVPALELGASRVIQWGGQGRSNGFSTLWDLVSYDQRDEIPADQRAAIDAAWHLQLAGFPLTVYTELADDDNQSGAPDELLQLWGVRSYFGESTGIHTVNLEYSDTYLTCADQLEAGNCAYQGSLYPEGYHRYGRIIGSGYGADAQVLSSAWHYQTLGGISWSAQLTLARYHQAAVSDSSWQLKLEHRRGLFDGLLSLQLRYLQQSPLRPELDHQVSAAGTWEYRF
ncbi:capsule assembly Wzi family protein [Rheinheimera texasensis]|uniref:capsule assembly Wzi family protein n=1 Tax=Rheinheimera texasensis TaxID=306205 RepID=UPI0004E0D2AF|nr:capsule assembly Wzi family protein [Rheinheimera texasensis]